MLLELAQHEAEFAGTPMPGVYCPQALASLPPSIPEQKQPQEVTIIGSPKIRHTIAVTKTSRYLVPSALHGHNHRRRHTGLQLSGLETS